MTVFKPKPVIDMALKGVAETHARTVIKSRDVVATIDEPVVRGGTNLGLTPTETLMAALIGCTNVISSRIAEKMGIELLDMKVDVDAKFDRRGVSLEELVEVPFPELTLTVTARSAASADQIEQLKADLAKFCAISMVIRQSGTKVTEVWNIQPL